MLQRLYFAQVKSSFMIIQFIMHACTPSRFTRAPKAHACTGVYSGTVGILMTVSEIFVQELDTCAFLNYF